MVVHKTNMKPTVYLATDHAGFALKNSVKAYLESTNEYTVIDCGAETYAAEDDYPEFIMKAASSVAKDTTARALIFGGSGQGEAMVANKYRGVRATVYYGGSEDIIALSREHNDANVLSIGARFVTEDTLLPLITTWLTLPFSGAERHVRRIEAFNDIGS